MDDQFDFGSYAPSVGKNSRSGSMKKLTRKTDQSPQPADKKVIKKNNDFDELDDLLNGDLNQKKKETSLSKPNTQKKISNTIDQFFDQPSSNMNLTSKLPSRMEPSTASMDFTRTSINFKPQIQLNEIIDEDSPPNFTKSRQHSKQQSQQQSKSPTKNQIKDQSNIQIHTSTRNMRPPIKRKDSQGEKTMGLGLSLIDDKKDTKPNQALMLSLDNQTDLKTNKINTIARRGSVDNRSQNKFQTNLTIFQNEQKPRKQTQISHFNIPQPQLLSGLRIDSPKHKSKLNQIKFGQSIMLAQKSVPSQNQITKPLGKPPSTLQNSSHYSFQPNRLQQPPRLTPQFNHINYQSQLNRLKLTYQKQIQCLQDQVDRQVKVGQETRNRLIKDADQMINKERDRITKMHQDEIKRINDMNQWEIKKMQDSYKFQIESLKVTITQYQTSQSQPQQRPMPSNDPLYKREINRLQQQLSLQKKLLSDHQRSLSLRQTYLQELQSQLSHQKHLNNQNLRQQQKILLQKQSKSRQTIMNQKKLVVEEKQKLAMEVGGLEIQVIKKREKVQQMQREVQIEKDAVDRERNEVRILNHQMMQRYKQKMDELAKDQERTSALEADLIRKLRIIQLKSKQANIQLNTTLSNTQTAKQNNWTQQRPQSVAEKQKQAKINETSQRYVKLQKASNNVTNKLNKTLGENKSGQNFKLDNYLLTMHKYQKRNNNFM